LTTGRTTRWAEVDLDALRHNVSALMARLGTGTRLCAVVKADAYGHGSVPVARAAIEAGATWLAVATVEEGSRLVEAGIDVPILNMGPTLPDEADLAVRSGLRLGVYERSGVEAVAAAASRAGTRARVHLKVDTGMTRLGVAPGEALELARMIVARPELELEGLWTHFAEADDETSPRTARQLAAYLEVARRLEAAGVSPPLRHCANSAAAMSHPEVRFDLVRCGLPVYGYRSTAVPTPGLELSPVLSWKARVVALHRIGEGDRVGYGRTFVVERSTLIATVSVGYADGYPRRLSGSGVMLVGGRRVPVIGRVSMDFVTVDATEVGGVEIGDEVVIIGAQGAESIGADELAESAGTIAWEVLCAVGPRVRRIVSSAAESGGAEAGASVASSTP
jgi:alanine racemase